jgi:hypothetical protein
MKYYTTVAVAAILATWALLSKAEVNQANSDGETIVWMPGGGTHPQYDNGTNIWWRNSHLASADGANRTRDMGVVELASVTEVPTEWDDSAVIVPLLADHVVVAQCADGFVKFKVVSTDTTGQWPAVVDFVFSTNATF